MDQKLHSLANPPLAVRRCRIKYLLYFTYLVVALGCFASNLPAAETDPEKHLGGQLAKTLTTGQAVWLEAGDQKFLAIDTEETTGKTMGGAIILPGYGMHPDWPEVISTLRRSLPDHGWRTLSLYLPPPDKIKEPKDLTVFLDNAAGRIKAAIAYLDSRNIKNITLIGYDLGAAVAGQYLAGNETPQISSFAGIGMGAPDQMVPRTHFTEALKKISLPVLDIYGGLDLDAVKGTAPLRMAAARKRTGQPSHLYPAYRQIEIPIADHFYTAQEAVLIKRITGWLKKRNDSMEKNLSPPK